MKPTRPAVVNPQSALILAIEPDKKQATKIAKLSRELPETEWVIADSAQRALQVLGQRVPNLILTSLLLSPRDEAALTDRLRELETAASHVQTLVIPVLGTASRSRGGSTRGLLKRLTGAKEKPATGPDGCDPAIFAAQIKEYLERAAAEREHLKAVAEEVPAQQVQLYGDAWEVVRAAAPLKPLPATPRPRAESLRSTFVREQPHEDEPQADEILAVDPPAVPAPEPDAAYDLRSSMVFDQALETDQPSAERFAEQVAEPSGDHADVAPTQTWEEPAAASIEQTPPADRVFQSDEPPADDTPTVPTQRFVYRPLFAFRSASAPASIVDKPVVDKDKIEEAWQPEPVVQPEPVAVEPLVAFVPAADPVVEREEEWSLPEVSAFEVVQDDGGTDEAFERILAEEPIAPIETAAPPAAAASLNASLLVDVPLLAETPSFDDAPSAGVSAASVSTDPWADILAAASGRPRAEDEVADRTLALAEVLAAEEQEPTLASKELEAFMNELTRRDDRHQELTSSVLLPPVLEASFALPEPLAVSAPPVVTEPSWASAPLVAPEPPRATAEPEPVWTPAAPPAPASQQPPAPPAPASPNLEVLEMLTAIRRDLEQLRDGRATTVTDVVEDEAEAEFEPDAIEAEAEESDPEPVRVVAQPPPAPASRNRTASPKAKAKPKQATKAATKKAPGKPRKKTPPIQDEWGFFDPDQCGFAALLAKLKEIEDDSPQEED